MRTLYATAFIACALFAQGQPGTLDPWFGTGGIVTSMRYVPGGSHHANAVALQTDGSIVAAGSILFGFGGLHNAFGAARFLPDGTLDSAFADNGWMEHGFADDEDYCNAVAVQADGKIVMAGTADYLFGTLGSEFEVVRLHANGNPDNGFGSGGTVVTNFGAEYAEASAVAIQADGKILVCGHSDNQMALVRYLVNGTPDPAFDGDGRVVTLMGPGTGYATALAVQPDGRILMAGWHNYPGDRDFVLVRYMPDGQLDVSFSGDGIQTTTIGTNDQASCIVLQPDGRILLGGSSNSKFAIARYWPDGSLDAGFSGNGTLLSDPTPFVENGNGIAVQDDGRILLAGSIVDGAMSSMALARYEPDGTVDSTFATNGIAITSIGPSWSTANAMTLQPDGMILLAGSSASTDGGSAYTLARYSSDGTSVTVGTNVLEASTLSVHPIPVQGTAVLAFELDHACRITCEVLDQLGRRVAVVLNDPWRTAGVHRADLDLSGLASGSYVILLRTDRGVLCSHLVRE